VSIEGKGDLMHRQPADARNAALTAMRCAWPALIAALVFVCFLPVLDNDFVNWDDGAYFAENPGYRGLSLSHLRWMFTTLYMSHYQPLSWLTHGLVYTVWGMNPAGYHVANLALHTANAVLLYVLILRLLRDAWTGSVLVSEPGLRAAAGAGALLWGIHPLRVEAVAWATERQEVLCAFFFLLSVITYLRMQAAEGRGVRWKWHLVSVGCFALSLLSKATGIMLPLVLLILDVYPLRRAVGGSSSLRRMLLEKIPYAAVALGAGVVVLAAKQQEAMVTLAEHGIPARAVQAFYGLCFYLWKTVAPLRLSPLYPLPHPLDVTQPRYILCALTAMTISVVLIALRRRYPWGLTAWACYVALLLPVLGLVQAGPQIAADRYTYLGCLPWAVVVAAGVYRLPQVAGLQGLAASAVCVALAAAIACLGFLTARQTRVWKDSFTLWNHVLQLEPNSYFAYLNRGNARQKAGDLDGALADFNHALRLNPNDAAPYNNRGSVRLARGDAAAALADFDAALRLNPQHANAYTNRANARQAAGDLAGALADFNHALRLNPEDARTYFNRGNARKAAGNLAGALADFSQALRLDPDDPAAYNTRGRVRQAQGDLGGAVADYTAALRLTPAAGPLRPMFERNLAAARRELAAGARQR
jgi:Tfp pilus assembly protein PilF